MKPPVPPSNKEIFTIGGYGAKQCHTRLQNDYDPDVDPREKDEDDAFSAAIMQEGVVFEEETIIAAFKASFRDHVVISTCKRMGKVTFDRALENARQVKLVIFEGDRSEDSLSLREELTHALLENPGQVRLLWNPRLRKWRKDGRGKVEWSNRSAEPDLLYRQGARVAKNPKWGSIDVKHHNPFEGAAKGVAWSMSTLDSPFPEKSVETPWVGTLKKEDAYQLAHYHRALEFHGVAGSPIAGIIGKPLDGALRVVWLDLNDKFYDSKTASALSMYDKSFSQVVAVVEREIARRKHPELAHLAPPRWKDECKTCPWQSVCYDKLVDADDVSLVRGVTEVKYDAHVAAGVTTGLDLAKLDIATATLIEDGVESLGDIIEAAKDSTDITDSVTDIVTALEIPTRSATSIVTKLTDFGLTAAAQLAKLDPVTARYKPGTKGLVRNINQARVSRVRRGPTVFQELGLEALYVPKGRVEIHLDMENDKHIYLWGMFTHWNYKVDKFRDDYHPFVDWSATDEGEALVFANFWQVLQEKIAAGIAQEGEGQVLVFHYTGAEDRCLKAQAVKHAGKPGIPTLEEVEAFIGSDVWVDLSVVLNTQLIWPTMDRTLKHLAKHVGFDWRDNDPSGANSVVWYQKAINEGDPEHMMYRERILKYNEDDNRATAHLLAWLQKMGSADNLDRKIPKVEDLALRYQRRR